MLSTKLAEIARNEAPLSAEALAKASGGCAAIPDDMGNSSETALAVACAGTDFPLGDEAYINADYDDVAFDSMTDEEIISYLAQNASEMASSNGIASLYPSAQSLFDGTLDELNNQWDEATKNLFGPLG